VKEKVARDIAKSAEENPQISKETFIPLVIRYGSRSLDINFNKNTNEASTLIKDFEELDKLPQQTTLL
jgi:hypothetical protein